MVKSKSKIWMMGRYLAKRWYYLPIIIIIWCLACWCLQDFAPTLLSMILLAYFARVCDDYFDFAKDKGRRLSRPALVWLIFMLTTALVMAETLRLGFGGCFVLLLLLFIVAMNKFEILKLFILPTLLVYYLLCFGESLSFLVILVSFGFNIVLFVLGKGKI